MTKTPIMSWCVAPRAQALLRVAVYQQRSTRYFNSKVKERRFGLEKSYAKYKRNQRRRSWPELGRTLYCDWNNSTWDIHAWKARPYPSTSCLERRASPSVLPVISSRFEAHSLELATYTSSNHSNSQYCLRISVIWISFVVCFPKSITSVLSSHLATQK